MSDLQQILVVDDEPVVLSAVRAMLQKSRFAPIFASSVEEALATLERIEIDAVLSDLRLPTTSGIDLIREVKRNRPDLQVLLMTGFASLDSAVQSIRAGAFDYITKPFTRKQLLSALERALQNEQASITEPHVCVKAPTKLCGSSHAIQSVIHLVDKIAPSRSNVLITGESGTGKELVARMIHATSMPADAVFVPIDCAAIPEGLLESELFGHVQGAFTGAIRSKLGLFEIANGGTIFLDEIADMPLGLQKKFLRALQEREFRRVGSTSTIKIGARIIAATNKNLREEIKEQSFRGDLFYRLNVIPIHLIPLRDHREDIRELAVHFVTLKSPTTPPPRLSEAAVKFLEEMPLEGNVRELENTIELALALCGGATIFPYHLEIADPCSSLEIANSDLFFRDLAKKGFPLRAIEDRMIAAALDLANGNKANAARALGISRRTLYRRKLITSRVETDTEPMLNIQERSDPFSFDS